MLMARAPLRVSLAGGGTDLESYYREHGGAVVSTTIDKYFYVFISETAGDQVQVSSSDYRAFYRQSIDEPPLWDGDMRLPRAIVHHFGLRTGLSIFLASQVPPGTGLGSSSTAAVALIKAMSVICGQRLSAAELAERACWIEIDLLGMPIGKQDQYAAAFGGLNFIEFRAGGVTVEPLELPGDSLLQLQDRLLLFFTGRWRDSSKILEEQKRSSEQNRAPVIGALDAIRDAAFALRADLLNGDVSAVGDWLHKTWEHKRKLANGISDGRIDDWYDEARAAGAAGGKLTGAGGGGFLLLYCEPKYQAQVTKGLHANGLVRMDFSFEAAGATVIVNDLVRTPAFSNLQLV